MEALGIDGLRLVWQIINFLILLFLLQRLLFKPILRLMDTRAEKIRSSVDEADHMRQMAEEMRLANDAEREASRKQAAEDMANASQAANQYRELEMQRAREEAERMIQRARDEIQLERDRAIADVRKQAVDLAILAAGKVVERELDPAKHYQLVTDFLNEANGGSMSSATISSAN